jgi:hypothetical protein
MTRTASGIRETWRSAARIERMFRRSVDLAGVSWTGLRTSVYCGACFHEVSTEPLPVAISPGDAQRALYTAYATHVIEKCEPVHYDDRKEL